MKGTWATFALDLLVLMGVLILLLARSGAQTAPALDSISLNASSIVGDNTVQGRVTLNMAAPADLDVSLAADPFNEARVPASVTIKAGETSAPFTVITALSKMAVAGEN